MDINLIDLITGPLFVGLRISGLMLFAPFWSHAAVPVRLKAALVIVLTAALYPAYSGRAIAVSLAQWPVVVARELMIGTAIGLVTNFVFEAAEMAGQILGIQVGYSLVNILDPQSQVETTVVSLFHKTFAFLIFLQLNVHHWVLRALAGSFEFLKPGAANLSGPVTLSLLHSAGGILETSLQIAAPVLGATIVADLILGFLGKAAPQMPLLQLGPAIKSVVGFGLLITTVKYWPDIFDRYFARSIEYTEHLLRLLAT